MQEIIVYDADGNSITNLTQYDQDVCIYASASNIDNAYHVEFFNNTMDEALVMESTYSNGILKVKIPNSLLIQPYTIIGYINITKNNESKCSYGFKIHIRKKPKPQDFIYVENNDYISLTSVKDSCRIFANNASNYASSAKSYAVGGTDTRPDEEIDNAKYYYEQTKILKEYCDALVSRLNEMQS